MARAMAILIVFDNGTVGIRQERYVQRAKWDDNGEWVGGTYDPDQATMLAIGAEAAESAMQEPQEISVIPETIHPTESFHSRAVESGRKGGLKGGPARARKLTPERRSEIAAMGAKARWEATHAASLPFPGNHAHD